MTYIVLASDSAALKQRVHEATSGAFLALAPGPLPAAPADLFAQLNGAPPPDVVILDAAAASTDHALRLAEGLDLERPGMSIVLVSDLDAEIGLAAMRAGVRDVVHPAADSLEFRRVLDRASQAAKARVLVPARPGPTDLSAPPPPPSGRIISVLSPKGGVGKTTVSTNIAVGLARRVPHSTVLVDLDVQFGDVAAGLNLDPEYSLRDAVHGPASRDTMVLKTFLSLHETGLYALCGPDSPAGADDVTADQVGHLLEMLASEFAYVVVDTAPGLSDHTLAAMDRTTDPVLLTSMDVPGVRGLRKELDTLDDLSMFTDNRRVVLNMADRRGGLTVADVEATLGRRVDHLLPRSKAASSSVNLGVPLLQSGGKDPLTKQLHALVEALAPQHAPGAGRGRHRGGRRAAR